MKCPIVNQQLQKLNYNKKKYTKTVLTDDLDCTYFEGKIDFVTKTTK